MVPPSQPASSTNWKPGFEKSKPTHSVSENRKVTTVVTRATRRMLLSAVSSSLRTIRMKNTPTSGRKVTIERIGQPLISELPRRRTSPR